MRTAQIPHKPTTAAPKKTINASEETDLVLYDMNALSVQADVRGTSRGCPAAFLVSFERRESCGI